MHPQGGCGKLYAETFQRTNQKIRGFQLTQSQQRYDLGRNRHQQVGVKAVKMSCQRLVNVLSTSCPLSDFDKNDKIVFPADSEKCENKHAFQSNEF